MQEYFAAKYICTDAKGKQSEYLLALFQSPDAIRFANTLDLAHDIDVGSFNQVVIRQMCEDFQQFQTSILPKASAEPSSVDDRAVRAALTYSQAFAVITPAGRRKEGKAGRSSVVRSRRNAVTRSERGALVSIHDLLNSAIESFRGAEISGREFLGPNVMQLQGEGNFLLVSIAAGIKYLMLEMLGAKGIDLAIRAGLLVEGRRASVDDIPFDSESVLIDSRVDAPWNTQPAMIRNLNRLLALHNVFVMNPKRCADFLEELTASRDRAEVMDRLVKGLKQ